MDDRSLVESAAAPVEHATRKYTVLYDGQCEVCQACVSWLRTLDKKHRTIDVPITAEALQRADSRLRLEDCLQQLHVVAPDGGIEVGWDAVSRLARLFPLTWGRRRTR